MGLSRRALLSGLAASLTAPAFCARAATAPRIVSLNWALSETLYAMQLTPLAAAEIPGYARMIGWPQTPPGVVDVGFQSEPNLELLFALRPDVALIQSWQMGLRPYLAPLCRIEAFTLYTRSGDPLERARQAVSRVADIAGASARGEALLDEADQVFADCRARIARVKPPPVCLIQSLTSTNLVIFASESLFGSTLRRLGVENAWTGKPDLLWGSTHIGVEALADHPNARIVRIASPGGPVEDALFDSALWRALPQVARGDVGALPEIWGFGGLPTALRFAKALTSDLTGAKLG